MRFPLANGSGEIDQNDFGKVPPVICERIESSRWPWPYRRYFRAEVFPIIFAEATIGSIQCLSMKASRCEVCVAQAPVVGCGGHRTEAVGENRARLPLVGPTRAVRIEP